MNEFYRAQIADLEAQLDGIAHGMGKGLPYDDYLVQVGKYKALSAYRTRLTEQLKKGEAAELPDDIGEEAPPRRPTVNRPRSWGGGRDRR